MLMLASIVGWVLNIVKIFHMTVDFHNIMFIMRLVGIFLAPLGAVLGFC